jgi:hypothetical protein
LPTLVIDLENSEAAASRGEIDFAQCGSTTRLDSVPVAFSNASWLWGGLSTFHIPSSFGTTMIGTSRS